jgi:pseudouridylate synthase
MSAPMLMISPEVSQALASGAAVVAMESSLIAQGLPWPENLETALEAQAAVRSAGATPATIAALGGRIRVGLTDEELGHVASAGTFQKASRRDLAAAVSRGVDAATTVSSTLWIARGQGIQVLATGGLGGVHREAATTFDVSNDLDELARADGALVVCSGVKSVLDLPATLDALETRGVVVAGYRTDTLPGFLTVSSGLPLELRVDTPGDAAAIMCAHRALGLPGSIVLAQPVPALSAIDHDDMGTALAEALEAANASGVRGKAVTPFLLEKIRVATEGRSLLANRALIIANARLAGEVAVALVGKASGPVS